MPDPPRRVTLVVLVALTVAAIGVGVYAFVEASLRDRLLADARHQADFNLSVLAARRGAPAHRRPRLRGQRAAGGVQASRRRRHDRRLRRREPVRRPRACSARSTSCRRTSATLVDERPARLRLADARRPAGPGRRRPAGGVAGRSTSCSRRRRRGGARPAPARARRGRPARRPRRPDHRRVHRPRHPPAGRRGGPGGRTDRRGDLTARVPDGGATSSGAWARRVQPDGGHARDDGRPARGAQQQNRRFVADVSHELRTPLTALVAEASLIERTSTGCPRTAGAPRAARRRRAPPAVPRRRAHGGLALRRGRRDGEPRAGGPRALVTSVVMSRLPAASIALPPAPVVVASDPRRLDRIVGNLVDNARDHAPDGPVEVSPLPARSTARRSSSRTAARACRRTRCRRSSTASTRPTRRGPAGARAWASRSPPSTRRCWARRLRARPAAGRRPDLRADAAGDRTVTRGRCPRHVRGESSGVSEPTPRTTS